MTPQEVAAEVCRRTGYELVDHAGSGSFKHTFHVRSGDGSRALKLYNGALTERSAREIDAMQRCDHPNIAKFIAIDSITIGTEQFVYALEEFLPGGSLTTRVGRITSSALPKLALPLVQALDHIAAQRLVHRDLKPDNVMFRDDSDLLPVIVDFGLVRDLSDASLTATWAMRGPGSPYFAAPEQLNNEKGMIDWRTDQFGLGATLAIAWLGDHPYARPGDTPDTIVQRVATWSTGAPAFINQCRAAGMDVLTRMVRAFPVQRFRTTSELIQAWTKLVTQ